MHTYTYRCTYTYTQTVIHAYKHTYTHTYLLGSPHDIIDKVLHRKLEIIEFELQLYYYNHFQTNAPWKRYDPSYPTSYGFDSTAVLQG